MKFKKGDYGWVQWEDSVGVEGGWSRLDEAMEGRRSSTRCYSAGIILADDKKGISIATSVHLRNVNGVMHIPRSAIRKRRRLK